MIPKKIHFCWFSGDSYPTTIVKCMDSWHQYMPDYEYILWDMERLRSEFGTNMPVWVQESLSVKKWAFVTDFIRLYAVYKYGGIYLDTDCVVYKSFDDLLHNKMFIGRECVPYATFEYKVEVYLTSHCFGAEPQHPFLKLNLEYYKDRHFLTCSSSDVPNELRYDMLMLPFIQGKLAQTIGYDINVTADKLQQLKDGLMVYPSKYFGLCGGVKNKAYSYARHLGLGGWRENREDNIVYDLRYKIHWRVIELLRIIASLFKCIVFEYR